MILSALVMACSSNNQMAPVSERKIGKPQLSKPVKRPASDQVTVKTGDTLYSISFAYGEDFKAIADINDIPPPYTIYPGQQLRLKPIPMVGSKATSPRNLTKKPTAPGKPPPKKSSRASKTVHLIHWHWPTSGKILRGYSSKAPRKKGIGITGSKNQIIESAADGKVVYSGDGLIGYGNLIIVKHNETYLSAYAHNSKVYVSEGQKVQVGQKIALMGVNESDTPMLHFEIRKNGKPTNPLKYLPKR